MKQAILLIGISLFATFSFAQSPTFPTDAKKIEQAIKQRSSKHGYTLLINYGYTSDASFYIEPNKTYLVYYVYDISPRVVVDFNVHLMSPDPKLEKKYTAISEDVFIQGSAKVSAVRFTTPAFKKDDKLPVKVDANPKADIYIFYK